jgi:uncharacterized repeat protein (TIGR01451 family)
VFTKFLQPLAVSEFFGSRRPVGGTPQTTQTVSVLDSADPVITGGDAFSYTVQYTNTGANSATSVSVAVTLDASLSYVSSSGTGWTIGVSGQVVTCTQASIAPGAAAAITINVTTGTGAVSASTTAAATASNAPTANGSQGTTVNLVTKDATAAVYLPANSTEWSNFTTRKGLTGFTPLEVFSCQEASGNLAGAAGTLTLTVSGTASYQQTKSGWSRKFVTMADAGSVNFTTTQAALPDVSTTSGAILMLGTVTGTPAATRNIMTLGASATPAALQATTTPKASTVSISNTATGATTMTANTPIFLELTIDRTNSNVTGFTNADKMIPTFNGTMAGKKMSIGPSTVSSNSPPLGFGYIVIFSGSNAEHTSTQWKSLYSALGLTPGWS